MLPTAQFKYFLAIIAVLALSRLIPHPPNVSVVTAMAIFGGAYFGSRSVALVVTLGAMLLSDTILGSFHSTIWVVYASFAAIVLGSSWLQQHRENVFMFAGVAFVSSVWFFITTNTAVWYLQDLYPHTLEGLGLCYVAALPFFQNSLISDIGFTVALFTVVNAWQRRTGLATQVSA